MSLYYQDEHVTLYHGDCLTEHGEWLDADVLVTDPPYGRNWRQGDKNTARGLASDKHDGIANDKDTTVRDEALKRWGASPAVVFGDLLIPPPAGTKHVLIYDKGTAAGFAGAIGGYRRNAEAIYLMGKHGSGLGGRSAIVGTAAGHPGAEAKKTGHPHTKPTDLMEALILSSPGGIIADPFAGSGSTLVAARNLGRKAIGVELEEKYCEIIAKRLDQQVIDFEALM